MPASCCSACASPLLCASLPLPAAGSSASPPLPPAAGAHSPPAPSSSLLGRGCAPALLLSGAGGGSSVMATRRTQLRRPPLSACVHSGLSGATRSSSTHALKLAPQRRHTSRAAAVLRGPRWCATTCAERRRARRRRTQAAASPAAGRAPRPLPLPEASKEPIWATWGSRIASASRDMMGCAFTREAAALPMLPCALSCGAGVLQACSAIFLSGTLKVPTRPTMVGLQALLARLSSHTPSSRIIEVTQQAPEAHIRSNSIAHTTARRPKCAAGPADSW